MRRRRGVGEIPQQNPSVAVMVSHRHALPQLSNRLFLTDGGIETTLIFHEGFELPGFTAFHLEKIALSCTPLFARGAEPPGAKSLRAGSLLPSFRGCGRCA